MKSFLAKYACYILILGMGLGVSSCGTTQKLEPQKVLYTGASINFADKKEIDNSQRVTEGLLSMLKPQPNTVVLGIRPRLWIYQHVGKKKGVKLKKRFGEPPVLLDTTQARRNTLRMEKYLQDHGYFHSRVTYKVLQKPNRPIASIAYRVDTRGRYLVRELLYPNPVDSVRKIIYHAKDKSLIELDKPFSLESLQAERQRISSLLSNKGYANFSPAYLYYTLDTLSGDREVRIRLQFKEAADSSNIRKYFIRNIYVDPDYSLDMSKEEAGSLDTVKHEAFTLLNHNLRVRPKILSQNIGIKKGDIYSLKNLQYTQQHLQDLGVYKFVNIKYLPDAALSDSLDAFIYLTSRQIKEVSASLEQDTRTGLFSGFGTNLSLNYIHRNLFRGAELLKITLMGGFLLQPGDTINQFNSLDFSAKADLYFPRFIFPFGKKTVNKLSSPKTRMSLNYGYQERIGFYTLGNLGASIGYQWEGSPRVKHEWAPISIVATELLKSTQEFNDILQANPSLLGSFSNTLIIGPKYAYTYQELPKGSRQLYHYFKGSIDLSGNLLQLGFQLFGNHSDGSSHKIFNSPYAQFSLFKWDYRTFYPLNQDQLIAFRFSGGLGIPYGNSQVLPYISQFIVGGPVSLRAFRMRALGPGSYGDNNSQTETDFVDRTGDIAVETNLEYRFPLVSYLKGALFLDAGNIWLFPSQDVTMLSLQEKVRYEQGVFSTREFLNQVAVGAGIGLRLDVEIFVIRLDVATPLRIPSRLPGERWVVSEIQPLSGSWLKGRGNLVWNIAIGYPF